MSDRSNCWTWIIYPGDSAPENYLEIFRNHPDHLAVALSPIHEPESSLDQDEKLKPHIHCCVYYGKGVNKSQRQVESFTSLFGGTKPKIVQSTSGLIRYYVHLDDKEKQQWEHPENEIISFNGFEYLQYLQGYESDDQIYDFLEDFIKTNTIVNLVTLETELKAHNYRYEWYFVRNHVFFFNHFLNAMYQRLNFGSLKRGEIKE